MRYYKYMEMIPVDYVKEVTNLIEGTESTRMKNADKLIETIRRASGRMNFDEYAVATGLDKEFIFSILKGEIEEVDSETYMKLSLKQ
ncbi:MAG: hypothetical protein BWY74_04411 [Firmicutes bacterium ADurb.Bin419]|nr:MAG: hypothetical protein BWY74_04411 [Firmicutes bacterium ADurb.Bin419]